MKRFWQGFVRWLLLQMIGWSQRVPRRRLLAIASLLGAAAYRLSRRYTGVARKNLILAFGDALSHADQEAIIREVFITFAKSFIAEFPWSASATPDQVKAIVRVDEASEKVFQSLLARGQGMIVVTAHFGNFELLGPRFTADGYKIAVVVRNDRNAELAEAINRVRSAGYEVIERGSAARPILRHLKQNHVVAMLPDQKSDDLLLPFFGRPTGTVAGPALMALRSGAPILPLFMVRLADDTHIVELGEPIEPVSLGEREQDVERIMEQVNAAMEKIIRKYPGQWLWLHDRWRNAPELIAKWNARSLEQMSAGC